MYRNWKKTAALGLAALLGCMMPMSTMLAAEDDAETGAGSVSENDVFYEEESASDNENILDGENASDNENVSDGERAPDQENADGMQNAGILTASVPAMEPDAQADGTEDSVDVTAPEIVITRGGANKTCSLGGGVAFEYTNNWGTMFEVSVRPGEEAVSLFYCLDRVTDMEAEAKKEDQMSSLVWGEIKSPPMSIEPLSDGCYVVYVKATVQGEKEQSYYARSNGIVVDTVKPVIKGVEEGKSYPEGTLFQVEDANLDYVLVNEQPVASEDGNYKVAANGTSCVIRAKDKAGNETTCSIIVFGTETPEPKPEEPGTGTPDDSNVISRSGEYALKAGVKYHLAEGKWKVDGDKSVYPGGSDFYVTADGSYKFTK